MVSSNQLSPGGIVVGVDGSPEGLAAADFAAREAVLHGRPLRVIHGMVRPYLHVLVDPVPDRQPDDDVRLYAERVVADAVARVRAAAPTIEVTGEVIPASGAQALIRRARTASLVVVGDRGQGAFTDLLVGSVAGHVAAHATCPVIIARGVTDPARPVLLAADGSPANDAAVGFAFEEAALRAAPLLALHVWPHPAARGPGDQQPLVPDEAVVDGAEAEVLTEALASWHDKYPQVHVRRWVARGHTRRTIIDASHDAQLAVVGTRGHGGFAGLLLGSVSQAVLRHAVCPTALVPHPPAR